MARLLRLSAAAEFLGFTEPQLRTMVQRQQIPFVRVGDGRGHIYFDTKQLDRWIERSSVPARAS